MPQYEVLLSAEVYDVFADSEEEAMIVAEEIVSMGLVPFEFDVRVLPPDVDDDTQDTNPVGGC